MASMAALAVAVVVVARRRVGPERPDPEARARTLRATGFEPTADGRWVRPLPGLPLTFEDLGDHGRWHGRLSRYGSLQLSVRERDGRGLGGPLEQDALLTGDSEFDERFVVYSDRRALALDVLADQAVGDLLLAFEQVDLDLRGDEIVVYAPLAPPTPTAARAEGRLHQRVCDLCRAVVAAIPR